MGCKKDTQKAKGEISYVNGSSTNTFATNAQATLSSPGGVPTLNIVSYKSTGVTENFSISIKNAAGITARAYNENDPNVTVSVSHFFPGGNIGVVVPPFSAVNFNSATDPVIVTITEISGSSVKGSFNGELRSGPAIPALKMTNGTFKVDF